MASSSYRASIWHDEQLTKLAAQYKQYTDVIAYAGCCQSVIAATSAIPMASLSGQSNQWGETSLTAGLCLLHLLNAHV